MEEEFNEEEVWAMVRETKDDTLKARKLKDSSFFPSVKASSASRKIPRTSNTAGEDKSVPALIRQSAPVAIPNLSKIFKKYKKEEEEEEGDEEVVIPPHEWIAKNMERNQISSFSVCEGEGRTLKGRDQRKVRNAVLSKTGFLD